MYESFPLGVSLMYAFAPVEEAKVWYTSRTFVLVVASDAFWTRMDVTPEISIPRWPPALI
jgi:hypothetical protein